MTILRRPDEIVYPEGDGKPMAESDLHIDELMRLRQSFRAGLAGRADVYVTGNILFYYEAGNPRAVVSPDLMVVKGVGKHRRVTYKLWEEGVAPCSVVEVASRSTVHADRVRKRELYERLGVAEYILYDPRFPGLETRYPPLQGYRLGPGGYEPMEVQADGSLLSEELGLRLVLEDGLLQVYDQQTGVRFLSASEQAEIEAERAEIEAERADLEAKRAELESQARQTEAERADAEAERADAEAERANAEANARRAAETRLAELERLLRDRMPPP